MHLGLDTEEYTLLQQIITHYGNQLFAERRRSEDLQRRLDAANERLELLEASVYGVSWL